MPYFITVKTTDDETKNTEINMFTRVNKHNILNFLNEYQTWKKFKEEKFYEKEKTFFRIIPVFSQKTVFIDTMLNALSSTKSRFKMGYIRNDNDYYEIVKDYNKFIDNGYDDDDDEIKIYITIDDVNDTNELLNRGLLEILQNDNDLLNIVNSIINGQIQLNMINLNMFNSVTLDKIINFTDDGLYSFCNIDSGISINDSFHYNNGLINGNVMSTNAEEVQKQQFLFSVNRIVENERKLRCKFFDEVNSLSFVKIINYIKSNKRDLSLTLIETPIENRYGEYTEYNMDISHDINVKYVDFNTDNNLETITVNHVTDRVEDGYGWL